MDDTDYAFGRSRAEYDRLIEQAELIRPLTERMLRAAGIAVGMRVLDVGCGVGDVSFLVAALVGPEGSVVGVDLDAEALKLAEERRTTQGITNLEFRESDVRSIDCKQLFDAGVGRFVLMFMSDPTATLRQIAERIRPGGIVAFHELDGRVTTAPAMNQPVLARLQDLFARTFERSSLRLHHPNPDDLDRLAASFHHLALSAASLRRTRPANIRRLKPWPRTSSSSLAPCRLLASNLAHAVARH